MAKGVIRVEGSGRTRGNIGSKELPMPPTGPANGDGEAVTEGNVGHDVTPVEVEVAPIKIFRMTSLLRSDGWFFLESFSPRETETLFLGEDRGDFRVLVVLFLIRSI